MRVNYFSCSAFADKVRGTPKPSAATSKEWNAWRRQAKHAHPIRFWLAEEALDNVQNVLNFIPDKIDDLRYYVNNRFCSRTNSLTAHPRDIEPGTWCDVGNRFLPCLFNELVNFVEVEKAWMHVAWNQETAKEYKLPFWRKHRWAKWCAEWRSIEAGLAHLDWEISLVNNEEMGYDATHPDYNLPTQQARSALEQKTLYLWWIARTARPDPYDVSGWSALCDRRRKEDGFLEDETPEEREESEKALDALHKLEQKYEAEDDEMLIRLIKIKKSLWT